MDLGSLICLYHHFTDTPESVKWCILDEHQNSINLWVLIFQNIYTFLKLIKWFREEAHLFVYAKHYQPSLIYHSLVGTSLRPHNYSHDRVPPFRRLHFKHVTWGGFNNCIAWIQLRFYESTSFVGIKYFCSCIKRTKKIFCKGLSFQMLSKVSSH